MASKPDYRLIIVILALVCFVVGLAAVLRPPETPYHGFLRQGDEHAARAERAAAISAYEEAVRLWPDNPLPYLRMAQVYLDWGRAEEALAVLSEAERLGVGESDAEALQRLRTAAHVARADWPAVAQHARRLLVLVPGDREASHALARAYVELRAWDAARAEYESLLGADPRDAVAHERLGVLLIGDDPAAIQHLFAARTDLAGRLLAALEELGVVDDPAYADAFMGRALLEAEEWALAMRLLEYAVSFNPAYADAHAYLGYALDQMGYPGEALPHLLQAVKLAPESVVAHTFLGLHYDQLGDGAAARAEYEAAYDLDPGNPATCVAIGQTWAAEGRYVAAEIWFLEAVSLRPDDPILWEALTRFYLDHDIAAEGQGTVASAELVKLLPGDARAHDLRGWAALQAGDYEAAEENLLRAISLDPMLAVAYYHLGLLRIAQGDQVAAWAAFVRALDLDTTGDLAPLVEREMGGVP